MTPIDPLKDPGVQRLLAASRRERDKAQCLLAQTAVHKAMLSVQSISPASIGKSRKGSGWAQRRAEERELDSKLQEITQRLDAVGDSLDDTLARVSRNLTKANHTLTNSQCSHPSATWDAADQDWLCDTCGTTVAGATRKLFPTGCSHSHTRWTDVHHRWECTDCGKVLSQHRGLVYHESMVVEPLTSEQLAERIWDKTKQDHPELVDEDVSWVVEQTLIGAEDGAREIPTAVLNSPAKLPRAELSKIKKRWLAEFGGSKAKGNRSAKPAVMRAWLGLIVLSAMVYVIVTALFSK